MQSDCAGLYSRSKQPTFFLNSELVLLSVGQNVGHNISMACNIESPSQARPMILKRNETSIPIMTLEIKIFPNFQLHEPGDQTRTF